MSNPTIEQPGISNPLLPARRHAGQAAALALAVCLLGPAPAVADYDDFGEDGIYCDVHRSSYRAVHFKSHPSGYVVPGRGGYRFYPRPVYASLTTTHFGRPAVFVSGGYFYPLWIGHGPVYEPTGYFEMYGGRFGRTQLGLRIGLNALPSVGFGFLRYPGSAVRYQPRPHWNNSRGQRGPEYVYHDPYRGHDGPGSHGRVHPRKNKVKKHH